MFYNVYVFCRMEVREEHLWAGTKLHDNFGDIFFIFLTDMPVCFPIKYAFKSNIHRVTLHLLQHMKS